jgi:hypothetical protein
MSQNNSVLAEVIGCNQEDAVKKLVQLLSNAHYKCGLIARDDWFDKYALRKGVTSWNAILSNPICMSGKDLNFYLALFDTTLSELLVGVKGLAEADFGSRGKYYQKMVGEGGLVEGDSGKGTADNDWVKILSGYILQLIWRELNDGSGTTARVYTESAKATVIATQGEADWVPFSRITLK